MRRGACRRVKTVCEVTRRPLGKGGFGHPSEPPRPRQFRIYGRAMLRGREAHRPKRASYSCAKSAITTADVTTATSVITAICSTSILPVFPLWRASHLGSAASTPEGKVSPPFNECLGGRTRL